ncbi:MAG: DegT/DnrJ/EryC1/StrS family aminotransferase [Candidatus Zixiibacteriota bacterium]
MNIPYLDLRAEYAALKPEIDSAISAVIDSSSYVLGAAVDSFEDNFAKYCGTRHCTGVSSGTAALVLALRALEIGPGDEVITAANTFVATVAAIVQVGAKPVLVDVDPVTRNIDPALIELALCQRTKAIVPVHLYGHIAPMDKIMALAEQSGTAVIEDAAQAHGAEYDRARAGSIGRMAAFSFYPAKNLGAFGEAGAVTTNDADLDKKLRMLRDHGSTEKYKHDLIGYNARMDGIQGAVLGVKLKYLDKWNERRRRVAAQYSKELINLPVTTPSECGGSSDVYHVYVIETDRRTELKSYLSEAGIPTLIHYPIPVHKQKATTFLGYKDGDFPVTERLADQILSLPIHPYLSSEQVSYVAQQIRLFFQ